MDGHVGKFFESVTSIFRGSDTLPVCDRDIIAVSTPPSSRSPMDASSSDLFVLRSVVGPPNFRWEVRGFTN